MIEEVFAPFPTIPSCSNILNTFFLYFFSWISMVLEMEMDVIQDCGCDQV